MPYPAGVQDAYTAVKNLWPTLEGRGLKFRRELSVAGDSGGGALATAVSALAPFDESVSIKKQTLIYPSVDYTMNTKSMEENATGHLLRSGKIAWYFDNYF